MSISPVPSYDAISEEDRGVTITWNRWFDDLRDHVSGDDDKQTPKYYDEVTVAFSDLASASTKVIQTAGSTSQYKVREIILSADGTNFNAGGDRDVAIQDTSGTHTYTVIPAATLKSLAASRWGDTGTPYPATASDLFAATTAGENLVAKYSGGSTDYTSGQFKIVVLVEKTA